MYRCLALALLTSWSFRAAGVWISVREVDGAETLANPVLGFALGVGAAHLGLASIDGTRRTSAATSLPGGVSSTTRLTPSKGKIIIKPQDMTFLLYLISNKALILS